MESDIVTRLRGAAAKDYGCTCVKCEAAAEIERLRAELEEMKKQLAEARGLYLQRNYHREQLERELAAAKAELAAAIKQRDEATSWLRYACDEIARIETRFYWAVTPQQIAERNGWDCFAEKEGGGA